MAEPERNSREINLGKDFGNVVIIAGDVRIEIQNGAVQVSEGAANESVAPIAPPIDAPKPGHARDRILARAMDKASEHNHAQITFNHLLLALLEENPKTVQSILSPGLTVAQLQRLVNTDLKGKTRIDSPTKVEEVSLGRKSTEAIGIAEAATAARYRTDRLFCLELLHAMLTANVRTEKSERSTTIDYLRMFLSGHCERDPAAECRKAIDRVATATGEKLPPQAPPTRGPSSAVTWNPEL